jgi:hypothetical protein
MHPVVMMSCLVANIVVWTTLDAPLPLPLMRAIMNQSQLLYVYELMRQFAYRRALSSLEWKL